MERRRFPRQDVRGAPLKATLVLMGGSLLRKGLPTAVEIGAFPINLSRSGVCISIGRDAAAWTTLSPAREVEVVLERGAEKRAVQGKVVRSKDQLLGLEFLSPLKDITRFLLPQELQQHERPSL